MLDMNSRTRRRKLLIVCVVAALVVVAAAVWAIRARGGNAAAHRRAGRNPTLGTQPAKKGAARYHCPMHPTYVADRPGDCPICGMSLVPIEEQEEMPKAEGPDVAGYTMVRLTPEKQQLIGVRLGEVTRISLDKTIRTVGKVAVDEARLSRVHTKIEGWIEKLYVDYTGKPVKKGQPLLTIYSPDLVSTQQEYLLALRSQQRLKNSPFPEVVRSGRELVAASRKRLELWDIPAHEIAAIEKSGEPRKTLTLHAPASGYVLQKNALEGLYVNPSMDLFLIADLSRVWLLGEIYETDLPLVRPGQRAVVTVNAYPGQVWSGRVSYIYPYMEGSTRTVKARLEFANPGMRLKPEMYANIELKIPMGLALTVPEEAVLDSGTRKIVFVDKGEGYFEPREVKLGARADSRWTVLSGVREGERIVISGNFLLDSESRLKAALEQMTGPAGGHQHGQSAGGQKDEAKTKQEAGGQQHGGHGK